jgi:hypothetical protein
MAENQGALNRKMQIDCAFAFALASLSSTPCTWSVELRTKELKVLFSDL